MYLLVRVDSSLRHPANLLICKIVDSEGFEVDNNITGVTRIQKRVRQSEFRDRFGKMMHTDEQPASQALVD